jgi:hypothetical protein
MIRTVAKLFGYRAALSMTLLAANMPLAGAQRNQSTPRPNWLPQYAPNIGQATPAERALAMATAEGSNGSWRRSRNSHGHTGSKLGSKSTAGHFRSGSEASFRTISGCGFTRQARRPRAVKAADASGRQSVGPEPSVLHEPRHRVARRANRSVPRLESQTRAGFFDARAGRVSHVIIGDSHVFR